LSSNAKTGNTSGSSGSDPKEPDVAPQPFRGGATQRIADGDMRAILALSCVGLFLIVFGSDLYGCFALSFCKDGHDVRDTIEPFASAAFTALGAAIAFYFADRHGR
jgi:hypothetical protein